MTTLEELNSQYKESGLSQIAFNSNGHDFYSETVKELLDWREAYANQVSEDRVKAISRALEDAKSDLVSEGMAESYVAKTVDLILASLNKPQEKDQ